MAVTALSCPVLAEPIGSADIRVIDGDTIRVYHEQPNVRLVGFNAPETRRATCDSERELGAKATRRLTSLVISLDLVPLRSKALSFASLSASEICHLNARARVTCSGSSPSRCSG